MDKPIRVLQIFTVLNRGGAESMIMNYYRHIDKSKVQFDFIVHREEIGAFESEIISLGGKIFRVPAINPLLPAKYFLALKKVLSCYPYRIIHSHINTFSAYPLRVAKEHKIPVRIAHAHTSTVRLSAKFILSDPIESLKIIFKNINKHYIGRYATDYLACGKKAGDWLFGRQQYQILSNSIFISKYVYSELTDKSMRREYGLEDQFVIGHVGNFSYPKNYPFILHVFKEILLLKKNSKLLLIGSGKMEAEVRVLASSLNIFHDIIFLGSRSDVPELMQMMNVFIFPSHYEGMPVTLIEAQASGLPIFASDTITRDVSISDNIHFMSLQDSYKNWAHKLVASRSDRKDNTELLKDRGYDVVTNAKELENYYLTNYKL